MFVGQVGENDYDAEGGDDMMSQNAAVDRNAGAGGFDWAFHQYDTAAADDDMMINNNLGGLPIQVIVNRDRWQETEADSGGSFNDVIKGTDGVLGTPRLISGGGFSGCDAIDQAGLARIAGLAALLPPVASWTGTAAQTASLSASGVCPLTGPVWGEGDILLGGPGSDTITGRTGDEIIDGDRELQTLIRVNDASGAQLGTTDLMEGKALSGDFGPGTTGMTLQQAVFAGLVDPGNLVMARSIVNKETATTNCTVTPTAPLANCDTAVFAGPLSQYNISANANGSITVTDTASTPPAVGVPPTGDGTDTLFNVEQLRFSDQTVTVTVPGTPTNVTAVAGNASATVSWTAPANAAGITGYDVQVITGGNVVRTIAGNTASTSRTVTALTNGTTYTFKVAARNTFGTGVFSAASNAVTPATVPGAPTIGTASAANASATVRWTAPGSDGGSAITGYLVRALNPANVVVTTQPAAAGATSLVVTGLTNGTAYHFQVAATNLIGTGAFSASSNTVTPSPAANTGTAPSAPIIRNGASGAVNDAAVTVTANWRVPAQTGGSPITSYTVTAVNNVGGGTTEFANVAPQAGVNQTLTITTLPAGQYRFRVVAINVNGTSPSSALSNLVTAR